MKLQEGDLFITDEPLIGEIKEIHEDSITARVLFCFEQGECNDDIYTDTLLYDEEDSHLTFEQLLEKHCTKIAVGELDAMVHRYKLKPFKVS